MSFCHTDCGGVERLSLGIIVVAGCYLCMILLLVVADTRWCSGVRQSLGRANLLRNICAPVRGPECRYPAA